MLPSPRPHATANAQPRTRCPRWGRWLVAVLWGLLVAAGYSVYSGILTLPERFNPWARLDVAATPNVLTPFKLSRAKSEPAPCLAALAQTGMRYSVLPDRVTGPGCGFENAVLLREAGVRLGPPVSLSCPMALSFAMWERHALQPAAQLHTGQRVTAITHLGSYACRNVNGGEPIAPPRSSTSCDSLPPQGAVLARGGPSRCTPALNAPPGNRSRHATADALDIAGFTLANGKTIAVLRQWQADDAVPVTGPDALFLKEAHRGACRYFKGVLGPDYNAAHSDHFHLETGGYNMCR
ncbi:extensin family protein [Polaromonas sp.]|uniref:extensin-like domain-containing protein n=1 Tax=Polaromonas sp. TaxID=1869339 RepID=UPI0037519B49